MNPELLLSVSLLLFAPRPFQEDSLPVKVSILAKTNSILLGEPLTIDVNVRNTSKEPISLKRVHLPYPYQDVEILISKSGGTFEPYNPGIYPIAHVIRHDTILRPAESWRFEITLLWSLPGPLVFAEPGEYQVKVHYPVWSGSLPRQKVESNTLSVKGARPHSADREVWNMLNSEELLRFIQIHELREAGPRGEVKEEDERITLKLAEILKKYPDTGYRGALHRVMRKSYYEYRMGMKPENREKLRQVLRITEPKDFGDARLFHVVRGDPDIRVAKTVVEQLAWLTKQSNVPLGCSPDLTDLIGEIRLGDRDPLQEHMDHLSWTLKAFWVKHGNGFVLTREEPR